MVAMGLAVAAVRLGLWGQGWGLPSRSTYAAQIAALLTAQWSGMPAAALGAWLLWRGRLRATMPPLQALPRYRPNLDRLTRLLTLVIDVAVVLNGLPFWARPRWDRLAAPLRPGEVWSLFQAGSAHGLSPRSAPMRWAQAKPLKATALSPWPGKQESPTQYKPLIPVRLKGMGSRPGSRIAGMGP